MSRQRQNKQCTLLAILLVLVCTWSNTAWAQTGYNRWDARPVPTPSPAAAAQRGAQLVRAKAYQDSVALIQRLRLDSVRIAAIAAPTLLKRGIGQRLQSKLLLPEDNWYFVYVGRVVRYPMEALRAQTEGDVKMKVLVDPNGKVMHIKLVESTILPGAVGAAIMIQQVRSVFRQLRFEPASSSTEEEMKISYKIQ